MAKRYKIYHKKDFYHEKYKFYTKSNKSSRNSVKMPTLN